MRHQRSACHGAWLATLSLVVAMLVGCAPSPPDDRRELIPPVQEPAAPAPLRCPPSGFNFVVIELAPDGNGMCQASVDTADKLPTLSTYKGFEAHWLVCNRCDDVVDVRLRSFQPSLTELFDLTSPPLDASNELVVRRVQRTGWMWGKVHRDAPRQATYEFSWRISGTVGWTDVDPRLEIEDGLVAMLERLLRDARAKERK